jgi:hypothetical protein
LATEDFLLGNVMATVISMITASTLLIRICIFDRAISKQEKSITIWWLCCLTIGKSVEQMEKKPSLKNSKKLKSSTDRRQRTFEKIEKVKPNVTDQ